MSARSRMRAVPSSLVRLAVVDGLTRPRRGQILVIFALTFTVMVGMAAVALDVGNALNMKRNYQKVAAICAVVGAQSLSTSANAAQTAAGTCVANNVPDLTPTTNVPPQSGAYAGDSKFLEVIVSRPQSTYFAKIFGVNTLPAVGRAVAGGYQPADFAVLALRGNIDSVLSSGGPNMTVNGSACSRGIFDVTGNFAVHGITAANQGYNSPPPPPTSDAGNVQPGPPCLDPTFALPSPLPTYTAPPAASTAIQCVLDSGSCPGTGSVVVPCPLNAASPVSVADPSHLYGTVYVNCTANGSTVQISDPRTRVLIDPANDANVELLGASPGDTGPGIFEVVASCGRADPSSLSDCGGSSNSTPTVTLKRGYYDKIDASAFGSHTTFVFKPGLYLISTGFMGSNGLMLSNTSDTSLAVGKQDISIVVGLTFDVNGPGGGSGQVTLRCCAPEMSNNVLVYHLGGCAAPYSASTPAPFPIWPDGGSCPALSQAATPCSPPQNNWCNQMQLQGNNSTKTFYGTLYEPYQCASSPNADTAFPKYCSQNHGTSDTRLPQFICGNPSNQNSQDCFAVGGGTTSVYGQLISPEIHFNGNGATVAPPGNTNVLGTRPYLAE